jgi:hypothetical protein
MRSWRAIGTHRRTGRYTAREIAELTHAAVGAIAARELTKLVLADLAGQPSPSSATVARTVAAQCADDAKRSALAAYLYLCRDLSVDALATVFGVDSSAARRLVERGTGTAPVTGGDECRGWALVAPRAGRTSAERRAGSGHLSLCRRCRNKLRAHAVLEQRVAAAGSVAFGASVTAAIGRAFAGSHAAGSAAGALTGPIVALSTAAALTAGAGTFAVTRHGDGDRRAPGGTVRPHPGTPAEVHPTPAAVSRPVPSTAAPAVADGARRPATSPPGRTPDRKLVPLPGVSAVPLPTVSLPARPLPVASISPPALPTSLPVPVPTLPVPTLPVPVPVPTLRLPQLP